MTCNQNGKFCPPADAPLPRFRKSITTLVKPESAPTTTPAKPEDAPFTTPLKEELSTPLKAMPSLLSEYHYVPTPTKAEIQERIVELKKDRESIKPELYESLMDKLMTAKYSMGLPAPGASSSSFSM